ncbi:hypothetical protein S40285_10574 [Stachybotrys chlorohalonatus IBT 40285]|uniref:Peptidase A1 domain-containing protein n=1 Tax=Stachybotrys chlorohalonatus (strain IBT 40285) TaxID=1283841 RepID=A0A084QJY6_STAC4|nr:hypothetical protein S40285_10574 [Stachybotrys chlorohalonata IBT 40285]
MATSSFRQLFLVLLVHLLRLSPAFAQDAGLLVHGGLEDASVHDSTYNSGGYISVQGFNITVPRNMLVSFPAAYIPWPEFVSELDAMRGDEIQVIGNFVNGELMAAQISTSQFFESLSSGYIESLNFTEGTMRIRSGPTLRISDPNGVFSVGYVGASFFNPLRMVPFLAGDFVTFSGIRRSDEVICYSIVANNVQVLTLGTLVYIRMELGFLGIDNLVSTNTELAESRFRGLCVQQQGPDLYAMEVDPCTAAVTDRIIAVVDVRANAQNRFQFEADILGGDTRDYRAVAEANGIPATRLTGNGILAGTFVQPVNEFIQGEQNVPGASPPANDFSQMPWLTQGVGVDEHGNLWGPLDPFPQQVYSLSRLIVVLLGDFGTRVTTRKRIGHRRRFADVRFNSHIAEPKPASESTSAVVEVAQKKRAALDI